MIILLTGIPCSGKSTIMERLLSRLPEDPKEDIFEPIPFWKCREYGDILHVESFPIKFEPSNQVFNGKEVISAEKTIYHKPIEETFTIAPVESFKYIPKFQEFCNGVAIGYKHTLIECDRYWKNEELKWVLHNHESEVYLLTIDSGEEIRRHNERHNTQSEEDVVVRKKQMHNIENDINLMGRLNVRENNNIESSLRIEDEIYAKVI